MDDKKWACLEPKEFADEFHEYLRNLELWLDYNTKCNDIRVFQEKLNTLKAKFNIVSNKIMKTLLAPKKTETNSTTKSASFTYTQTENKTNDNKDSDSIEELS